MITLADLITEVYKQGGDLKTPIAYKDMNFGGIDTSTYFNVDNITVEKDTILLDSAWFCELD